MALFSLCGCSPQEKVTIYVDCNGESVKRELSFLRGGQKILTFHPEFQIGFMYPHGLPRDYPHGTAADDLLYKTLLKKQQFNAILKEFQR
jgi:hypothetical protein